MKTQATTDFSAKKQPKSSPLPTDKKNTLNGSKIAQFDNTSRQVRHQNLGFLKVSEAAERLQVNPVTVKRWCETGKLAAIPKPYGQKITYLIHPLSLEMVQGFKDTEKPTVTGLLSIEKNVPVDHSIYYSEWVKAMERGLITGKPYSDSTLEMYQFYATEFLQSYKVVSSKNLRSMLMDTPKEAWSKRFKLYKAIVSFAKYLIMEEHLDKGFLDAVKPFNPKRHIPPKQLVIDETQLKQLLAIASTPLLKAMVLFFGNTGLRVSEVSKLLRSDIDFEKQCLRVLGKGNKYRWVGLASSLLAALQTYFAESTKSRWLFADETGKQLSRMALYNRLKLLGKKAKIEVTPH